MYLDAHVHLRDFNQRYKETIQHGLEVAYDSGVDAVFDMPNTDPPITNREMVVERLQIARDAHVPTVFYGIYMGLTADVEQVKRAVDIYQEFPQVVGMKLYAGHSVGDLGAILLEDQHRIYEILTREGYNGVLAVHAEKEFLLQPDLWKHRNPRSHCRARPEEAEVESVRDQLHLAFQSKFQGKLHITHISSPGAVNLVEEARPKLDISCGITPHHFIYDWNQMDAENGLLWKMNPPLRRPSSREKMFQYLREGKIDWIETDHAPHSLEEKMQSPHLSGIPGLAWWPLFTEFLRQHDFSEKQIADVTFHHAAQRFGLELSRSHRQLRDRRTDYPFDPYQKLARQTKWQP